jgi:hypothetical protein
MKRSEHGYFGRREFIQTMVAAGLISASSRPAAAGQPTFGQTEQMFRNRHRIFTNVLRINLL